MTTSETETLKMFDEWMKDVMRKNNDELLRHYIPAIHEFLSNRLARADERKKAYEDGKNATVDYIKDHLTLTTEMFAVVESARKSNY